MDKEVEKDFRYASLLGKYLDDIESAKTVITYDLFKDIVNDIINFCIQHCLSVCFENYGEYKGEIHFPYDKDGISFTIFNLIARGIEIANAINMSERVKVLPINLPMTNDQILNFLTDEQKCWLTMHGAATTWWE